MKRGKWPLKGTNADRNLILIAANAFWNIKNFRGGLIDALIAQGFDVLVAAPDVERDWIDQRCASMVEVSVDRSGLNPVRDLALVADYHRLMRSKRPKIFLGFTAKPNIYGAIAGRFSHVACLPNISGLGTAFINPGFLSSFVAMLYRLALASCPIVFFQNGDDRDLFVRRGIVRPDQARLLPGSGVDLDRFRPAPQPPSQNLRFLFVGRILRDKGVREFVDAARLLRKDHPDWTFELLGPIDEGNRSGIDRAELDAWVADGIVEYGGLADDVRPHVAAATAVVLPSYREGLPRSLLEAAAMARPLIATDVPGNRRIVEHGVNGLLCEARSSNSLAAAMLAMGQMDPARREAMGEAGRAMVERDFGEQQVVQAYLEAIAQLLAGRGS